jgi:hypothetical protein
VHHRRRLLLPRPRHRGRRRRRHRYGMTVVHRRSR